MADNDKLLEKLEERFIMGEISEESYLELKEKLNSRIKNTSEANINIGSESVNKITQTTDKRDYSTNDNRDQSTNIKQQNVDNRDFSKNIAQQNIDIRDQSTKIVGDVIINKEASIDEKYNTLLKSGIGHLNVKNYESASVNFQNALELKPNDLKIFLYLIISKFKGKNADHLTLQDGEQVFALLKSAFNLEETDGRKILCILAVAILQDFYAQNGMINNELSIESIVSIFNNCPWSEFDKQLLEHVKISDKVLQILS